MIEVQQTIVPGSRTGSRGSAWIAEATIDGVTHSARSRSGAPFELARQLVAAGIPDQPVRVVTDGLAGACDLSLTGNDGRVDDRREHDGFG